MQSIDADKVLEELEKLYKCYEKDWIDKKGFIGNSAYFVMEGLSIAMGIIKDAKDGAVYDGL